MLAHHIVKSELNFSQLTISYFPNIIATPFKIVDNLESDAGL